MSTEETHAAEETLWSGRPSQWNFLGQYTLGFLFSLALLASFYFSRDTLSQSLSGVMPWAYGITPLPLLIVIGHAALQRRKLRYCITNRRVIIETGLIVKDSNEIRIQDIRSINVAKRGLGGFFGIGTVEFSSAATDDAEVVFQSITGADGIRDLVRKLQS